MTLDPILDFAKTTAARTLAPGAVAIDATVGNGYDTLFLARRVGDAGHVYGFDVQAQALAQTRERLVAAGVLHRVTLVHAGHETLADRLPAALEGHVATAMFNLGYLPGSDKTCITRPRTTVDALESTVRYLKPGGVTTVVCYTGHEGGRAETEAVEAWAQSLAPARFRVLSYRFVNQRNDPPRLLVIERNAEKGKADR